MTESEKRKEILENRRMAYVQTFLPENVWAKAVIEDLKRFCRAELSTFHPDARMHAVIEGRREVWLRISDHINLSPEELQEKYLRPSVKEEKSNE